MVLRSPCILKKARIHKMPTAVTEVISLWVIKFLPWRERPQERTDIFLHMEMRFSQRFRLRCVYELRETDLPFAFARTPAWRILQPATI